MHGRIALCIFMWWQLLYLKADKCVWKISLTKLLNITEVVSEIEYPLSSVDITNAIKQMDNALLYEVSKLEKKYFAYPYNILLGVECLSNYEVDGPTIVRNIVLQGGQPYLSICRQANQTYSGSSLCILAKAALIDLAKYKGNEECLDDICEPAWIVPFVYDGRSPVLSIEVYGPNNLLKFTKINFNVHGYNWLSITTAEKIHDYLSIPNLFIDIRFIPGKCPVKILGPLKSQGSIYITEDNSEEVKLLQLSDIVPESTLSACSCLRGKPYTLRTATLEDRMLILTQGGLYELHGHMRSNRSHSGIIRSYIPSGKCIIDVALAGHRSTSRQQQLLLIGGCNDKNSVFVANFTTYLGKPLNFSRLEVATGLGPCQSVSGSDVKSCRIVTCLPTHLNQGAVYCLLSTTLHYMFIMFTGSSWQLVSEIPLRVVIPIHTADKIPIKTRDASNNSLQTISLNRVITSIQVTKYVYLAGSCILYSSDGGTNFYVMPWSINGSVVITAVSVSGYIVFVTEYQQIWVTQLGSVKAERIYPSLAWKTVNSRHGKLQNESHLNIVSSFFDTSDDLQLLLLEKGKVHKYKLPLVDILQIIAGQQSTTVGKSLDVNNSCPISDVSIITPSYMLYTRNKIYSFSPPHPAVHEYFHGLQTLLVYHALIQSLERFESKIYTQLQSVDGKYQDSHGNVVHKWKNRLNISLIKDAFILRKGLMTSDIFVDFAEFGTVYEELNISINSLPEVIYLSRNQTFTFKMFVTMENKIPEYVSNELILSTTSSNPDVLLVSSERQEFVLNDTVKYEVTIREGGSLSRQSMPGRNLLHTSVVIALSTAPMKCFQREQNKIVPQGQYIIEVEVGCIPGQYVLFDWRATKQRVTRLGENDLLYDCAEHDPELPCFFFGHAFYPYFNIYDDVTGQLSRFAGNYTLKIIGAKLQKNHDLKMFSEEDAERYNKLDRNGQYLIWSPTNDNQPQYDGWPVYTNETNGITWVCQSSSICADVRPVFPKATEFYFLMEFSNRDVDQDSYCDYTKTFLVHVHGLPISHTRVSTIVLVTCLGLMVLHIAIYYLIHLAKSKTLKPKFTSLATRLARIHPSSDASDDTNQSDHGISIVITRPNNESDMITYSDDDNSTTAF